MRFIIIILITIAYTTVLAQSIPIFGDSEPTRLNIGGQPTTVTTTTKPILPGQKIQGTSEKIALSFGLQEQGRTVGAKSGVVAIKIGEPIVEELRTTAPTPTAPQTESKVSGTPNYYALFIGIDSYQFASANLSNLNKPLKDAVSLKDILISQYSFPPTNSSLLKNPTRAEILRSLEDLAKKVTPKDNLLIFYAGHGYWDERLKVGYWLPSDSRTDDKSSWIANSTIRDYIAGIQSKHTLLISDACFSGSIFKTREVTSEINEYGVSKIYQLPSRKAMTSGTLTTVPDDSKFMQYLVKRLTENNSKYLTARQLYFSLETAVLNNTNTVPQLGVIQETGDEGGDFIFIRKD
jgi:hypothetical protein